MTQAETLKEKIASKSLTVGVVVCCLRRNWKFAACGLA